MKKRNKRNVSEESYWKSATDIMAGVLLVILLVLMLLLLYLTQLNKEKADNTSNADYIGYGVDYEVGDDYENTTEYYDHNYDGSSIRRTAQRTAAEAEARTTRHREPAGR